MNKVEPWPTPATSILNKDHLSLNWRLSNLRCVRSQREPRKCDRKFTIFELTDSKVRLEILGLGIVSLFSRKTNNSGMKRPTRPQSTPLGMKPYHRAQRKGSSSPGGRETWFYLCEDRDHHFHEEKFGA